jgi:hypothetical protein
MAAGRFAAGWEEVFAQVGVHFENWEDVLDEIGDAGLMRFYWLWNRFNRRPL